MRIIDGRPRKDVSPNLFKDLEQGALFYSDDHPETIFMKTEPGYYVDLSTGETILSDAIVPISRVKAHLVVEEIED